jgi:hypothetical protein
MSHGGVKSHRRLPLTEASDEAARRANQYGDNTSSGPSLDECGQPANVATQPKLGLLSEWRAGRGRDSPSRIVASWKNLKLLPHA